MFYALTAYNYAGEPSFRVFPDDDRFQYTQLFDVQNHPFVDRKVDALIVKRVRFVGNGAGFQVRTSKRWFSVGAVYKL